jgi:hypothetical protein
MMRVCALPFLRHTRVPAGGTTSSAAPLEAQCHAERRRARRLMPAREHYDASAGTLRSRKTLPCCLLCVRSLQRLRERVLIHVCGACDRFVKLPVSTSSSTARWTR